MHLEITAELAMYLKKKVIWYILYHNFAEHLWTLLAGVLMQLPTLLCLMVKSTPGYSP